MGKCMRTLTELMNERIGHGVVVYDPAPGRVTVMYKDRYIKMVDRDLDDLDTVVEDGIRFVRIEGTRWA